jgi:hypothetical protein
MYYISTVIEDTPITYWVDQMTRYIDALAITATDAYIQKHTCMAV